MKYSQAHQVAITVQRVTEDEVRLTISDDGVGFNIDGTPNRGLGLISMRERVEAVGGTLSVFSKPGSGTRVIASAPIARQAA
jgi:signal transduction histidine kinase